MEAARDQLDELKRLTICELSALQSTVREQKLEKAKAFKAYLTELHDQHPEDDEIRFARAGAIMLLMKTQAVFNCEDRD